MKTLIRIEDEDISQEQFINYLKLTNEFPRLIGKMIRSKIVVHEAKQNDISVSPDEIQQAADDFRRCFGLHSAKDTYEWMDKIGVEPDDFESFITDFVYRKKMESRIASDDAVEKYFRMNAAKFDKADIRRIVVDNENKAKELTALLNEDSDNFESFARKYSIDDSTRQAGGLITGVRRGCLPDEIDAKVFGGQEGDILGPFHVNGDHRFEIVRVDAIHSAQPDDSTQEAISEILRDEWFQNRSKEYTIQY